METAKEFLKAENRHALKILRVVDGVILEVDPTDDPEGINLQRELMRRANYRQIRIADEQLYLLGKKNALGEEERVSISGMDDYILGELSQHILNLLGDVGNKMEPALKSSLQEGYRKGESYEKLAGRVQAVWDTERSDAMRLVRTASNEIYNQAHLNGYKEIDVERIQYKAIIDSHTSAICRMLHNTIWDINDPDIVFPPAHFFCRSRIVSYFGKMPGERDYTKLSDGSEISQDKADALMNGVEKFRTKYWNIPTLMVKRPLLQV